MYVESREAVSLTTPILLAITRCAVLVSKRTIYKFTCAVLSTCKSEMTNRIEKVRLLTTLADFKSFISSMSS